MLGEGNSVDYESFADGRCYYDCNLNRTNTCTQPFGSHTCGNVLMGGPDDDRAEVGGGFTVDPGDHSVNIDVQLVKGGLLQEIGP